jgi:hypothetical protein
VTSKDNWQQAVVEISIYKQKISEDGMPKKISPDYFGWIFLFTIAISIALFWLCRQALNHEKRYTLDFLGYSTVVAALIILALQMHKLWILIKFLQLETGRTLVFHESEQKFFSIKKVPPRLFY